MQIQILKIRENVQMPIKAYEGDAGYDLFFSPEATDEVIIYPGDSVILPTGIKVRFPSSYMLEVKNKGGIAAKRNLIVGSCVIDSTYRGEVFVNLHNIGNIKQVFKRGDKIAQMVPVYIGEFTELIEVNELDENTQRGEGCLGSSDEKKEDNSWKNIFNPDMYGKQGQ